MHLEKEREKERAKDKEEGAKVGKAKEEKEREKEKEKAEKEMEIADNGWQNRFAHEVQLVGTIIQSLMAGYSTRKLGRKPRPRVSQQRVPLFANGMQQGNATKVLIAKSLTILTINPLGERVKKPKAKAKPNGEDAAPSGTEQVNK
jgi:hypothetical protein